MGSKEDLKRIGWEGFALVDKYFNKKGRPANVKKGQSAVNQWWYQPQQNPLHQVKPVPVECYEVVHFGEAMSTKDYQKWVSAAKSY